MSSKVWEKARLKTQDEQERLPLAIVDLRTNTVLATFPPDQYRAAAIRHCEILDEQDVGIGEIDLIRVNGSNYVQDSLH